jgi:AcrR family transcriptional regulator
VSGATVRRVELLDHARRVIVRDGLTATSLRRISREGGYTTGMLSHHFADKRELIAACFEWTMNNWLDGATLRLAAAPTAEGSVREYVRIAIPWGREQHGEWRLWLDFCTSGVGDAELATLLLHVDDRWDATTADAFARWQAAGLVRSELAVAEQATILARLVDGLGLRALMTGDWDSARLHLVNTLRSLGLPEHVAAAALEPPRGDSG